MEPQDHPVGYDENLWNKDTPLQYTICAFEVTLDDAVVKEVLEQSIAMTFTAKDIEPKHGIRIFRRSVAKLTLGGGQRPS